MKRLVSIAAWLLFAGALCAQTVLTPTAPSNLAVAPDTATYPNLQALGSAGWTVLYGTSCCGGSNSGTGTGAWGIASPSLSGGSMSLTNVYTGASGNGLNSQMYTTLNCSILSGGSCLSANNIKAEVHYYIPSSSATPQALEGPNVVLYDGTDQEYPSLQCNSVGDHWWVWNSAGATWVDTGNSCTSVLTTNVWHDITANYVVDGVAHTLGYLSVYVDGVSQGTFGQAYPGETDVTTAALKAQVQLDGNEAGASTTTVYYDRYDVTVTTNPTAATPTASPVAGTYSSAQSVSLTSSTSGATLCYTTDGSIPTALMQGTCSHGTTYSTAISVSTTQTIQAIATKTGYNNSGLLTAAYTISGESQVATPTFSTAAGSVAPGTGTTPSDSTSGALIWYTTDGTTPAYSYDSNNGQYYPATASTEQYRTADYPNGFTIYAAKTIKLLASKSGMTDSAVASAAYTLTAPTGTALSACGTLAASTNYYLTGNVSSTGTCMVSGGNGWTLNLNGYTITYGTGQTAVSSGTNGTTNNTTTFTVASGTPFSTCPTGKVIDIDDGSQNYVSTTVSSCPSSSSVILAANPGWSSSGNNWHVWPGAAVYGVECDASVAGGNSCTSAKIYNGTITQTMDITPSSNALHIGSPNDYGDNGSNVFSDLTIHVNSQDNQCVEINYGSYGDTVQFNNCVNTSTVVYNRDELVGYSFRHYAHYNSNTKTTPLDYFTDNTCTGGPQGCIEVENSAMIANNYADLGPTQYVGGYCWFAASAGITMDGGQCTGNTRGIEMEASYTTAEYGLLNTTDSSSVHDPGHNPNGCEIDGNYGVRSKDYVGTGTQMVNNVIVDNKVTVTDNTCGGTLVRYTQLTATDTGSVTNNDLTLNMNTATANNPSSVYSLDESDGTGLTYSGNIYSITGSFASQGYAALIAYDAAQHWTLPGLVSPSILYIQGTTNSTATFTGTGTATCTEQTGGTASLTATWNGSALSCP